MELFQNVLSVFRGLALPVNMLPQPVHRPLGLLFHALPGQFLGGRNVLIQAIQQLHQPLGVALGIGALL